MATAKSATASGFELRVDEAVPKKARNATAEPNRQHEEEKRRLRAVAEQRKKTSKAIKAQGTIEEAARRQKFLEAERRKVEQSDDVSANVVTLYDRVIGALGGALIGAVIGGTAIWFYRTNLVMYGLWLGVGAGVAGAIGGTGPRIVKAVAIGAAVGWVLFVLVIYYQRQKLVGDTLAAGVFLGAPLGAVLGAIIGAVLEKRRIGL